MNKPMDEKPIFVQLEDDSYHIAYYSHDYKAYAIGIDRCGCCYCGSMCRIKFNKEEDFKSSPLVKKWEYLEDILNNQKDKNMV